MNGLRTAAVLAVLALGGCATSVPPTEVTRFHLNQPIAPGSVIVTPRNPASASGLEFQTYAAAVTAELQRLGFATASGMRASELIAVVDVQQGSRQGIAARSPFSVGIGGGTFGGGVGIGGGVSFPIGRPRSNETVVTELFVQLKRRSEGTIVWEGRALTEARAGTPLASTPAAVQKLARALFQGFPGESGRTISVR
jgi:hypothetical protein